MWLRLPERQMKSNSLPRSAPMGLSASPRRSTKAAFSRSPGNSCHSTSTGRLPIDDKSGRPTYAHSAIVRTSIRIEPGSLFNLAHVSSTETTWMRPSPTVLSALTRNNAGIKRLPYTKSKIKPPLYLALLIIATRLHVDCSKQAKIPRYAYLATSQEITLPDSAVLGLLSRCRLALLEQRPMAGNPRPRRPRCMRRARHSMCPVDKRCRPVRNLGRKALSPWIESAGGEGRSDVAGLMSPKRRSAVKIYLARESQAATMAPARQLQETPSSCILAASEASRTIPPDD